MRAVVSLAVALVAGCQRGAEPAPSAQPAAASSAVPVVSALPADHTLPGELAEGPVRVGGLTLPAGFHVDRAFEGETHARGSASPEQTANYLRRRLDVGNPEIGATRTIFPAAHVRGAGGNPLRVEVNESGGGSEIVVIELKPAPVDPSLSQEERWRRAGFKPQGGLLDPQKSF